MAFFKLNDGVRVTLASLAVLLASSQMAIAETIFLKCDQMDMFTVDLTKHTVNNGPANITPIAIDWDNINKFADVHLHIDRATGVLTTSCVYYRDDGDVPIPESTTDCTKDAAPDTKF